MEEKIDYDYIFEVKTNMNKIINVFVKENDYKLHFSFYDSKGELQTTKYDKFSIDVKILVAAFLDEFGIIVDYIKIKHKLK